MRCAPTISILLALALAGCSASGFDNRRTVFNNPYAPLELENGPVGPACDEGVLRDDNRCWIDGQSYPVSEFFGRDRSGNLVFLNREQRELYRDRRNAIEARLDILDSLENGTPIPADSPALPENQRSPVPPVMPSED